MLPDATKSKSAVTWKHQFLIFEHVFFFSRTFQSVFNYIYKYFKIKSKAIRKFIFKHTGP